MWGALILLFNFYNFMIISLAKDEIGPLDNDEKLEVQKPCGSHYKLYLSTVINVTDIFMGYI